MPTIKRGKVITITSMKGGVGKTITTLLLAAFLKKEQKRTLIIDLDLYNGDIAFGLDVDIKSSIYNLCDDMANNRYKTDEESSYIIKYDEYIDILSSPKDPRQATKIEGKYLEMILKRYINKYDVILIDTNHILSVNNMIAFEMSDAIINIFTNDAFDLKNTRNFMAICENIHVDNVYLVLNDALGTKKEHFSEYEIKTIIKNNISYVIPKSFYIKGMDKAIVDGRLFTMIDKVITNSKDTLMFNEFVKTLLKTGGDINEKE